MHGTATVTYMSAPLGNEKIDNYFVQRVVRVQRRRYRASTMSKRDEGGRSSADERSCFLAISLASPNSEGAKFEACIR